MSDEPPLERFRELLRIPTVSRAEPADTDWSAFDRFGQTLARLYPATHAALELERFEHTLLFRWRGREQGDPTVLMAHYDVVAATDAAWQHEPFSAEVTGEGDDRMLWARGAFDNKPAVAGILESVEPLAAAGHVPQHDVYLLFSHDEETHGSGARAVVDAFEERGIRPALVLDEGGAIAQGVFPGVRPPVAFVGVGEKRTSMVRLVVEAEGGHAATPPRSSASTRLARALDRIHRHPMPVRVIPPVRRMFRALATRASGAYRPLFRVLSASPALVGRVLLSLGDEARAMARTTIAITTIHSGDSLNAMPGRAEATLNVRILPGQTIDDVLAHVRRVVGDDGVRAEVLAEPADSGISADEGAAWERITGAIERSLPDVAIAPYLQLGATDSRWFWRLTDRVYRFTPYQLTTQERAGMHGIDERIPVRAFLRGLGFYAELVRGL